MKTWWLRRVWLSLLAFLLLTCPAFATSSTLVISQVYSGQFVGASIHNDFIELFNLGSTPINLTGWTLQIAAEDNGTWTAIPLTGTVAPGQYYLFTGTLGFGPAILPSSDVSNTGTPLDPIGGRLALVNDNVLISTTCPIGGLSDLVDFISYGSSTACSNSTPPQIDASHGMIRVGGGCVDTDSNVDFTIVSPYPRNTSSPPNVCGASASAALKSFSIPSGGGVSITTSGTGTALTVGSGWIEPASGKSNPSGVAIFGLRQNGVLVTEAGVPAAPLVQNALIYVEANGPINTGIAITNPNNQDVTINFDFNDASKGYAHAVDFGSLTIPANGQLARFITELPYAFPGGLEGTIQMTATAPIGIVALRGYTNERSEFLVTTLPVIDLSTPASTSPTYLAHFAAQGGWSTQIALINSGGDTATGTINFLSPSGQPLTVNVGNVTASSFSYSIPSLNSQSLIIGGNGAAIQTGSVSISLSSGPATPVAVAVFAYVHNNVRVSEAGLIGVAGSAFRTYVEASGTSGAVGSIQSGLAVANTGTQSATVTLQLTGLDGTAGLSTSISLPPSGQTAKFLNELFPSLPGTFKGILRVSTTGSISVVGLRGRYNERDDFLITTVPPANESTSTSNRLVVPHFADSGGYTTQFILYGPAGQASSGNLHTVSPGGQPLPILFQ